MMNRFCFLFCILLLAIYPAKGQTDDRSRFETLMDLAKQMDNIDYGKAMEHAEEALSIGKKTQNPKMIAQAQMKLASIYFDAQNISKVIEYGTLCEPFFEKSGDVEVLSSLYNLLSNAYFYIGNAELSDMYSDKSIELAEKHQILDMLFKQYYNRGAIAYYRGDYSRSMEFCFKALNVVKKLNQNFYLAHCYDLMGSLSRSMAEYHKAVQYYNLSLNIYLEENNKISVGQSCINLAIIYTEIGRRDSVRLFYYKALDFYREAESTDGLSIAYTGLAGYYLSEEKLDTAQIYLDRGLKTMLLSESTKDLFNLYNTAGNIYFKQGNYPKALEFYHKALNLALLNKNSDLESMAKINISRTYGVTQRFDSAYHYLLQSYAIEDSLRRYDEIKKRAYTFAEHNVKEQFEKEMMAKKTQQRLWIIIICLCGMVIIILSVFIRLMIIRQRKIVSINDELNKYKSDLEDVLQERTHELMLSEQQILNLSNNLPKGAIFRFLFENEHEGKVLYVSSGWEELTGQSINDTANDSIFFFQDRIHPEDSQSLLAALTHAIKNHTLLDKTFRYYKNNNELRWFHVRAMAIASNDGQTYLDGFQVDETKEKHFEQELVAAKNKAEESDKLKSAFLANMSHEIRTPMNAIIGFSSLLNNKSLTPQRQSSYLEIVQANCHRLLSLIDDIVDISKIEAEQLNLRHEHISVSEIMTAVKEHFEPIIKSSYPHVELWIDEVMFNTSLMVHTDAFRLKQIFIHLIDNALKFTEKGFVRCDQLFDMTDALHFIVMDTGMGIAPENTETIFLSFRKLDEYSEGTGLGLSIVRKVLLQMGGSIWVESEVDVGSTFHFILPMNNK